jgi:hypothetical protein
MTTSTPPTKTVLPATETTTATPTQKPVSLSEALSLLPEKKLDPIATQDNVLVIPVMSVDGRGQQMKMTVVIRNDKPVLEWGVLERAAVLKTDSTSKWSEYSLATIINAIIYADRQGLSIEEGDIYIIDGKITKSANAVMKQATATGKIKDYTVRTEVKTKEGWIGIDENYPEDSVILIEIPWQTQRSSGIWKGPYLRCIVTVMEKDGLYHKSVGDLKEWFKGSNESWKARPRYMLETNTKGKAFSMVRPGGSDLDAMPVE